MNLGHEKAIFEFDSLESRFFDLHELFDLLIQ